MIYKFTLISDEVDNFKRVIQIDPDAKFIDLFKVIFKSIKFENTEDASFFVCDDDWETRESIQFEENDNNPEYDTWLMDDTVINEFIEEEGQRLMLQFDAINNRNFFIELTEIILGKDIKSPKCTLSIGEPPIQFLKDEEVVVKKSSLDVDESFYGDSDFDSLEIEGFENLDNL